MCIATGSKHTPPTSAYDPVVFLFFVRRSTKGKKTEETQAIRRTETHFEQGLKESNEKKAIDVNERYSF